MDLYKATMVVEGVEQAETPLEYVEAVASLIKSGDAWRLQGFFGRTCAGFIDLGIVSKEGEILVDEETIWNLFEETYK
jgi:hypothetical protein